jgi:predicted amidophosphoribosyltransferase
MNKSILTIKKKKIDDNQSEIQLKNVKVCHYCMKTVPSNIVCCWNCGNVLDKNLEKLMEMRTRNKNFK